MKKLLYLSIALAPCAIYAMERTPGVESLPADLKGMLLEYVAASSAARHEGPEKYNALRTLLQDPKFKSFTVLALNTIAAAEHAAAVKREAQFLGRTLTEDEKNNLKEFFKNLWYIAVEIGTPEALEWIKAHPADKEIIDHIRDAANHATNLDKKDFSEALWKHVHDFQKAMMAQGFYH